MKNIIKRIIVPIIVLSMASGQLLGQDISGQWTGILKTEGAVLRIMFQIQKTETGYRATMDSPDQNAFGIPVSSIALEDNILKINIGNAIFYEGKWDFQANIAGIFKQNSMEIPLNLVQNTTKAVAPVKPKRPQDPKMPHPYQDEEVHFDNPAAIGVTLAGTLTLPKNMKGQCPAVVLVSGSGQQDRNEEIFGHKPFAVIADYLTRQGIAVLRYDDRGTMGSTGRFDTCSLFDFATDAEAAFNYLKNRKEIDSLHIGIIGHSEGGIIAPIVAARNREVDFIVMLAGTAIRGDSVMYLQRRAFMKLEKYPENQIDMILSYRKTLDSLIIHIDDLFLLEETLTDFITDYVDKQMPTAKQSEKNRAIETELQGIMTKWYRTFIKYDPTLTLSQIQCPVLAFNGEKDFQISAPENLGSLQQLLTHAGNSRYSIHKMPNLNHLFQNCNTGALSEYAKIAETFSPKVLKIMANWILQTVR